MASEAFSPAGWGGYFEVESDATKITEAVSVLSYDLSLAPASFWSAVASDGRDIRITNDDGSFAYSFELVNFSVANETGILFFDSSSVISTSVNRTWRVYAGNEGATMPAAADALGRNAVWSGYEFVQHFVNSPVAPTPQIIDSTGNGYDVTALGSWVSGNLVTGGPLGAAWQFVSDNRHAEAAKAVTSQQLTIEAWALNANIANTNNRIVQCYNSGGFQVSFELASMTSSGQRMYVHTDSNQSLSAAPGKAQSQGVWHHWMGVRNVNTVLAYLDAIAGDPHTRNDINNLDAAVNTFSIGRTASTFHSWIGNIAELRLSLAVRSPEYAATRYNNENSPATFWSTGEWVPSVAPSIRRSAYYYHHLLAGAC